MIDEHMDEAEELHEEQAAPLPKLSPEELEQMRLRCVVCGDPLSNERAKRRNKTCSDAHSKLYNQHQRYLRSSTRCPACYRPSTPAERKSYRAWRTSEGGTLYDVRRGRPRKGRERELTDVIQKAIHVLNHTVDGHGASEALRLLTEVISPKIDS